MLEKKINHIIMGIQKTYLGYSTLGKCAVSSSSLMCLVLATVKNKSLDLLWYGRFCV